MVNRILRVKLLNYEDFEFWIWILMRIVHFL